MEDGITTSGGSVLHGLWPSSANSSTTMTSSNSTYSVTVWDQPDEDGGAGVREPRRPKTPRMPDAAMVLVPA